MECLFSFLIYAFILVWQKGLNMILYNTKSHSYLFLFHLQTSTKSLFRRISPQPTAARLYALTITSLSAPSAALSITSPTSFNYHSACLTTCQVRSCASVLLALYLLFTSPSPFFAEDGTRPVYDLMNPVVVYRDEAIVRCLDENDHKAKDKDGAYFRR